MHFSALDTPALLVDMDRVEANLVRVAEYATSHGLRVRPHTKTHKSRRIAQMQLGHGAIGLTVAKVGEAEVMASVPGLRELLVAYPVWGDAKWSRLVEVAKRVPVTVGLDSIEAATGLSRHADRAGVEIGTLVEVDVGMRRCGMPPGADLMRVARAVDALRSLRLRGLMFYPGHANPTSAAFPAQLSRLRADLDEVLGAFRADGLSTEVVSGGSTPTLFASHLLPGLTEIRPGTYVFNDRMQVSAGSCAWGGCAASVLTTVVSRPRPRAAIIDGGSKTFTSDLVRPDADGSFGRVLDLPGAEFHRMSEEHGVLDLSKCEGQLPRIGQQLRIVPNHVCVTVNMHEMAYGLRGETVAESWPVAGRGKLQ